MQPYLTGHPRLPGTPHSAPSPEDESKQRLPEIGSAFLDSHPLDYYTSVRYDVVSMIPPGVQSILEVGCGAGQTGRSFGNLASAGSSGWRSIPGCVHLLSRITLN